MSSKKVIILILLLLGFLFLHFYAPRFITEINNPLIRFFKHNEVINSHQLNGKLITFKSFDNTSLTANLEYSKLDSTFGTVILLHGIRSNKESFLRVINLLNSEGFNTVALDSRAHGQSGGKFCTFGVKEKKDVSALIDFLDTEENIDLNIGLWGQSLGGAIGIQALSTDKRLKFGIIESTFSDFRTITHEYFKYHLGFNFSVFTDYLINRAGEISNFNPNEANPSFHCKNVEQPILLIHGDLDKRINIKYVKENFVNLSSKNKTFIEIKGANHLNVWDVGGSGYFNQTIRFLKNNTLKK